MKHIHTKSYRAAFAQYLRHGTPIRRSIKQANATDQYVWRTQRDEKVRRSHRLNEGRIFSYDGPPATGHPGADFGCRCEAAPYIPGRTEFAFHDFTTDLASADYRWGDLDFVHHYYYGGGQTVTLREIGHLRAIAEYYSYSEGGEGAFRRLADQIAGAARTTGEGEFTYPFGSFYNFQNIAFSHGDSTVRGVFIGRVQQEGMMLVIEGTSDFEFHDEFVDPLRIGIEPGGHPYDIVASWRASFSAQIYSDKSRSDFVPRVQN